MSRTQTVYGVCTKASDETVQARVAEVKEFERFSALKFPFTSEQQALEVLNAESILVTGPDGVYVGHVEDWDDAFFYVNLD
jgi:tRNA A37 threonylcarbamoyladenosine synthetase subunit TsaC/SUA5/YrdC